MFNITHYINDTDFQIIYLRNQLNIINYQKINYMEDTKISLSSKNNTVVIIGEDLRVKKLLNDEILIVGIFSAIEFRK